MYNLSKFSMYLWCKDFFPICRSITGKGVTHPYDHTPKTDPTDPGKTLD